MDSLELARIAQRLRNEGDAVMDQTIDALRGDYIDCNPNALRAGLEWLRYVADGHRGTVFDIDDQIDEFERYIAELESGDGDDD